MRPDSVIHYSHS